MSAIPTGNDTLARLGAVIDGRRGGDPEQSYDITLRRCHIYNCGISSLNKRRIDRDHVTYTEACRVEYDHCVLGPPREGSGGSSASGGEA